MDDLFEDEDTAFQLRFHSLYDQITDAMSQEMGQEVHDIDSARPMRLDSPAKKLLDSVDYEDEDLSDDEHDASFVTALETLSENGCLTDDQDVPIQGRRRSLADEIADATFWEEGDPFDDEDGSAAGNVTCEPSVEVRRRWSWVSAWCLLVESLFDHSAN